MYRYLPSCQTWSAEEVPARFYPHVLVMLGAYFTQLECATHLAVQFVLLRCHFDVLLRRRLHRPRQVRIDVSAVGVQVTANHIFHVYSRKVFLSQYPPDQ